MVLNDKLLHTIPKADFGGIWIDKSNDRVKIGFVNDDSDTLELSRRMIADEVRTAGISDGVDVVPVQHSFVTLDETTDSIYKLYQENVDRKEWPIQMGIKTDLNKVQVDIPADSSNLTDGHQFVISEIKKNYGDQTFFETYDELPEEQAECNWWFCNSPLRGGVGIKGNALNYSQIDCTAGFIVQGNSTGNLYVLTAGHCEPAGLGWGTETYNYTDKRIGSITNTLYDDATPIDAMIIRIRDDTYNWNVLGGILKRGGGSNMGLNGYGAPSYDEEYDMQTVAGNVVGARVCVSGAITGGFSSEPNGGSCGAVHQLNIYLTAGGVTSRVHRAGYCSRPGDSGAPVYSSPFAANGIHRAAGSPESVCSNYKYFTPMGLITDRFNDIGSSISLY